MHFTVICVHLGVVIRERANGFKSPHMIDEIQHSLVLNKYVRKDQMFRVHH